jgi:hypothetical protein
MQNPVPAPPLPPPSAPAQSRWTIGRITMIIAGVLIGLVILVFVAGLALALIGNARDNAPKVQIIRDIFIIILAFQSILIIGALAVLIAQIARLINLLQNEVMPILKNTQDTVSTARTTVEFVGNNMIEPVIRLNAYLAAMTILLRELFGIRRAVRRSKKVPLNREGVDEPAE